MMNQMNHPRYAESNFNALKPFLVSAEANPERHCRYVSEGYEPLVIEYIYRDENRLPVVSMMHYFIQYGDVMRDPEITFSVDFDHGLILPRTYRLDTLGIYQEAVTDEEDGTVSVSESLVRQIDDFLHMWLHNLVGQGFSAERTDPPTMTPDEFAEKFAPR